MAGLAAYIFITVIFSVLAYLLGYYSCWYAYKRMFDASLLEILHLKKIYTDNLNNTQIKPKPPIPKTTQDDSNVLKFPPKKGGPNETRH